MCVLSIKVPIRKKSGNLSYAPHIYIYIYIYIHIYIYIYIYISTINKSAHTKKVWKLIVSTMVVMLYICGRIFFSYYHFSLVISYLSV